MKKLVPLAVVAAALAAWIAVSPATSAPGAAAGSKLQLRKGKLGRFVVDGRSMTLYLFEKDKHGKSTCYSSCAKVWSPLIVSRKPTAGAGVPILSDFWEELLFQSDLPETRGGRKNGSGFARGVRGEGQMGQPWGSAFSRFI